MTSCKRRGMLRQMRAMNARSMPACSSRMTASERIAERDERSQSALSWKREGLDVCPLMAQRTKRRLSHEYAFESASWACIEYGRERGLLTFDGTENEEFHQRERLEGS